MKIGTYTRRRSIQSMYYFRREKQSFPAEKPSTKLVSVSHEERKFRNLTDDRENDENVTSLRVF